MISRPIALLRMVDFKAAVKECTAGQPKVKKRDYLLEGPIPVIDQGQSLIAGYSADDTTVFSGNLPVVLFGDHTLVFKYVDFPFALGADGVKVLSIHKTFLAKYLFYYWQSCKIGSRGYSRHFKFLREIKLPLIPLSEQHRIVELLGQADALHKKRADTDAKAARILAALFYKMFGDPLLLMLEKNTIPLGKLDVDLQNGFACGDKNVADGTPHLRMNNIDDAGVLNMELVRTVPVDRDEALYRLKYGDVLFMGTNSEDKIGKSCIFHPPDKRHYLFSNHLIRIRVNDERITPEYLASYLHLLWTKHFYPSIANRWVNQASVTKNALVKIGLYAPESESLNLFSMGYRDLLSLRNHRIDSSNKIDELFNLLLHRAFTGDLTAKWREAHMKELLAEMEAQARHLESSN